MTELDPVSLNLKVGFEIHQQLATKTKLFCSCSCKEAQDYDYTFMRRLRPTQSELGAYDPAAMFEAIKMRAVEYQTAACTSCAGPTDDTLTVPKPAPWTAGWTSYPQN